VTANAANATAAATPYSDPPAQVGTVRSYNAEKGYGFLTPDAEGAQDVFVHVTAIAGRQPLAIGAKVTFRVGEDRDHRPCAVDVALLPGG